MSVGPNLKPARPASAPEDSETSYNWLAGTEGELLSVRMSVEPRMLEKLLDALARLDFPINPQIYHEAALVSVYADGHEEPKPTTIVEFPAYARRLPEVKAALEAWGFGNARVAVRNMLDGIRTDEDAEPAPASAPYRTVIWRRHAPRIAAAGLR